MKANPENILEQALQQLNQGENFNNVIEQLADNKSDQAELSSELKIAQLLSSIPKSQVPTPTMSYRYKQNVGVVQKLLQLFNNNKVPVFAAVFAFMVVASYSMVNAANNSLPGDKLYGIKLISEEARINLTFDQDKVANLHLALAEKRLQEVKRVIETNNPQQEAEAIVALTNQTEKTFNAVSQIATAKAVSQNDSRLLDNLVAINKEQKSVLESASKSQGTKESAEVALSVTKATDKNLAKIIATVNEQALLDLPNKISITGSINSYAKNKLIIEKTTFTLTENTIVISSSGELIVDKFDNIEGKVTVIGTKDNDQVIAKKIIIIDGSTSLATDKPADKGTVKGVTTSVKPKVITTPSITPTPETSSTEPQKPSQTQAGFIVETNEQQYSP